MGWFLKFGTMLNHRRRSLTCGGFLKTRLGWLWLWKTLELSPYCHCRFHHHYLRFLLLCSSTYICSTGKRLRACKFSNKPYHPFSERRDINNSCDLSHALRLPLSFTSWSVNCFTVVARSIPFSQLHMPLISTTRWHNSAELPGFDLFIQP